MKLIPYGLLLFALVLKMEYNRVGSGISVTPREIIRDFIEILNILLQNPDKGIKDIIGDKSVKLSENIESEEQIHSEFADFEL